MSSPGESCVPNQVVNEQAAGQLIDSAPAVTPASADPVMTDGPRVQHLLGEAYRNGWNRRVRAESQKPLHWGWYAAAVVGGLFVGAAGPSIVSGIANTVAAEATRQTARRLERKRDLKGVLSDNV